MQNLFLKFSFLCTVGFFCASSFATDNSVIKDFMLDMCKSQTGCMYTGVKPTIGFEINGKKAIAQVNAVKADAIWLSNPKAMTSRGWTADFVLNNQDLASNGQAGRPGLMEKQNNFCKSAFGNDFISSKDQFLGVAPQERTSKMKIDEIYCQKKNLIRPDFAGAKLVNRELSKKDLERINGTPEAAAKKASQ